MAATSTAFVDAYKFLQDNNVDMATAYWLAPPSKLPLSEGDIDDETFIKYGIITAINYRDAIELYRQRHRAYSPPVREPMEVV